MLKVPTDQPSRIRRVAILIGLNTEHGRGVMRGLCAYARPARSWVFRIREASPAAVKAATAWNAHGIVAEPFGQEVIDLLRGQAAPVVAVSSRSRGQLPSVTVDNEAVGRMAAEHFLQRGYRHFAFFGARAAAYSEGREAGYREVLSQQGLGCASLYGAEIQGPRARWELAAKTVGRWLASLPKPVAVFASHDEKALLLSETCREYGLAVPEEVALLGVDDDELACEQACPTLSSIKLPTQVMGFEVAKMLDVLMAGADRAKDLLVQPVGVEARQSTDILAIADAEVSTAMRFINDHAADRITIAQVVKATGVCRRVLERRFRSVLGRTLLQEVHRVRLERAKELLAKTAMSVPKVARSSGFRDNYHLWSVFRQKLSTTPADYRKRTQLR